MDSPSTEGMGKLTKARERRDLIERLTDCYEGAALQGKVFANVDRFDLEEAVQLLIAGLSTLNKDATNE